MDNNLPGNGSPDPDPRDTSQRYQDGSCFESEGIENGGPDYIGSSAKKEPVELDQWEECPVTRSTNSSAEPLEGETPDCYGLHEPIAPDADMVDKDRYLTEDGSPLTHFEAVKSYSEQRHGETTTASRHGWNKGRQYYANRQYMRGMAIDRQLLDSYSNPTTALLSLRISPTPDGRLMMLTTLKEAVDETIGQLRYRIQNAPEAPFDSDEWEFMGVYAGTDERATPHFHLLVYIDGDISESVFEPVVNVFVSSCEFTPDDGRGNRPDEGAVEVRGNGDESIPYVDRETVLSEKSYAGQNSQGAVYILTQLPHLRDVDEMARDELLHSATTDAWGKHAFRSSMRKSDIDEKYLPSDPM